MSTKRTATAEELLPLLETFNSINPIGRGVEQYLLKAVYWSRIPKGGFLVRSGEVCNIVAFVRKGLLRSFIKEDDKEITTRFGMENELVTILNSFIMQTATQESIQAVEDCELLAISFTDLNKLYQKYPSFNAIGRRIMELYYIYAEKRAYITRLHDAEKKYELFLEFFSPFANRIQVTYIASFLGITIETLSRVRAKASVRKKGADK